MSRRIQLAGRPVGEVKESDFELVETEVGEPGDGEFVCEVTHISIDPAMRGWMNAGRSYIEPVEVGDVMRALTLGRVVDSRHDKFAEGDIVVGTFGVREHAISDGKGVNKITPPEGVSLTAHLGILGMTGFTAYFGLLDVGRVQEGDTVLVSGAAGAVGTAVGQIAKIKGARAVGIAGGPEKCRMLVEELGFDAAVDYKSGDLRGQLRQATPDHVDVFFDNVGGEVLDHALTRLARGARVVICGAVSQYNNTTPVSGPSNYMMLLVARATMSGFVVFDYADRYAEAIADLSRWLAEGRLHSVEDTVRGDIESFPEMLARLFSGRNTGKLVLELDR
ncbi:MAG TPA: NADP-dependent oxidoreductase [Solirubrobacteraceae bacterium]|nr:NADP-dependent oxidoreductase [Solirubrobacteraceae bacterium]